ncbi:MAG: hypothetical protein Q9213_003388 [Squamulea squamosa]
MHGTSLYWALNIDTKLVDFVQELATVHEVDFPSVQRPNDPKTQEPIKPAHEFDVRLEPDNYTEEKYQLFENYQRYVHKERPVEISRSGFKRFLCSGLGQSDRVVDGRSQKLGSYHHCYRLDGRLVAMGVLDLLPGCVSSVYLMYHQDVKDWYFGKLSALREITLATEGEYKYYYMGFYIHSCIKMRYKGQYQPSEILADPGTYSWDPLDADFLARLSARRYVSMSMERRLRLPPHQVTNIEELGLNNDELTQYRHYQKEYSATSSNFRDSQISAFTVGMPGVMSLVEVESTIPLGRWVIKIGNRLVHLDDLQSWAEWDIRDATSLKGYVAELAAALGPDLVDQLVLKL